MAENRFSLLKQIVNELHEEFVKNDYQVSEEMVDDLWSVFGGKGVEKSEKQYNDFKNQWSMIDVKVLGGLKEAFVDHLNTKKNAIQIRSTLKKVPLDSDISLTVAEASEIYGIPYSTLRGKITREGKKGKIEQINEVNPARYYRRDLELICIPKKNREGVSAKTKSIEDKYSRSERKAKKIFKTINKKN